MPLRIVAGALRCLLPVLALLCLPAAAQELRVVRSFEPQSLDPHKAGTWEYHLLGDLYEGLTASGPDGATIPGLAQSWTVSPDGRSYSFKLRPGLAWSDGTPLTAADIVWSFRRSVAPATGNQMAHSLKSIRNARGVTGGTLPAEALGVSAPAADEVRVELEWPDPTFPDTMAGQAALPVPRHLVEARGEAWAQAGPLVSNGPFRLLEAVPNSHVRLERNPRYHDAASVRLERLTYYPLDDSATALKRYRAGEIDVLSDFPLEALPHLRAEVPDQVRVTPALGLQAVMVNTRKPPLDDPRLRRALSLLVDRDVLADQLLRSGERGAWSYVPPHLPGYAPPDNADARLPKAERVALARRLAAEAGVSREKPLRLLFRFTTSRQSRRTAIALSSMFQEIGVSFDLVNTESRVTLQDYRAGRFDLAMYQFGTSVADPIELLEPMLGHDGFLNLSGFDDPRFDALLGRARQAADPADRARLVAEAEAIALAALPYLPLYHIANRALVSPRVRGWADNVGGIHPSRFITVHDPASQR